MVKSLVSPTASHFLMLSYTSSSFVVAAPHPFVNPAMFTPASLDYLCLLVMYAGMLLAWAAFFAF